MSIESPPFAPRPPKRPRSLEAHGDVRVDEYWWLREKKNPEVRAHLEAENAWCEANLADVKGLENEIFREMVGRMKEDDASVPEPEDGWEYWSQTEPGKQYSVYWRRARAGGEAQTVLDCNLLAEGREYFQLGFLETSPDHRWAAYGVDFDGSEHYEIRFKNLETGELSPESIADAFDAIAWAEDSRTVFFVRLNEHDRPDRVFRHRVGDDPANAALVYQETDPQLLVSCGAFASGGFVYILSSGKETSEWRVLESSDANGAFRVAQPRRRGVQYSMEHRLGPDGGTFYFLANDAGANFRLCEAPARAPQAENWRELIPASESVYLEDFQAFERHLAIEEREAGISRIRIVDLSTMRRRRIDFPEPVYEASLRGNPERRTKLVRFSYSSMVSPNSVYDFDMDAGSRTLRKRQEIPSGYDPAAYVSERVFASAPDGAEVPISVVRRRDVAPGAGAPLYLYGYGAYGISVPASFSIRRLSLLDRGFVYAIAHVRGGAELGRRWYEDGKFLKKENTFGDFIACAERLIELGYGRKGEIAISGGSAGGLLVAAAMNMRPELFKAAVLHVPFVDVLNTMLDDALPLTTEEYEEWGNPNEPAFYRAIKAYSPYDNLTAQPYPDALAIAGFNDPRVTYWEPAKWIARLRDRRTDDGLSLLYTHMGAGHGGASGRYESLRDDAREQAFLLKVFGMARRNEGESAQASPLAKPHGDR